MTGRGPVKRFGGTIEDARNHQAVEALPLDDFGVRQRILLPPRPSRSSVHRCSLPRLRRSPSRRRGRCARQRTRSPSSVAGRMPGDCQMTPGGMDRTGCGACVSAYRRTAARWSRRDRRQGRADCQRETAAESFDGEAAFAVTGVHLPVARSQRHTRVSSDSRSLRRKHCAATVAKRRRGPAGRRTVFGVTSVRRSDSASMRQRRVSVDAGIDCSARISLSSADQSSASHVPSNFANHALALSGVERVHDPQVAILAIASRRGIRNQAPTMGPGRDTMS